VTSPSQRPLPDNTQHLQETDIHDADRIRTHNPSKQAAAYPLLRPRGHKERHSFICTIPHLLRTAVLPTSLWYQVQILRDVMISSKDTNPRHYKGRLPVYSIQDLLCKVAGYPSSASSIGATARCELWPVEQYPSILSYLSPALSIFLLLTLEDLFLLLLSILSWAFPFVSSLPVFELFLSFFQVLAWFVHSV